MDQPFTAVVVTPRAWERDYLDAVVRSLGLRALTATDFHSARLLLAYRPHLLITELRLGQYNGLHLVLHASVVRPRMAAIVASRSGDAVVQRDAETMGATFVQIPTGKEELMAAIVRTVTNAGLASVERIRPPFERRRLPRRAGINRPIDIERRVAQRRRDVTSVLEEAAAGRMIE
jgi:DNA-binding NtrC family response regulator